MPYIDEPMLPRRLREADVLARIATIALRLNEKLIAEQAAAAKRGSRSRVA